MNIAILTNEYPPNVYGGAGVHVEYLTKELSRLDEGRHHIHVLCFGDQQGETTNVRVDGVNPGVKIPVRDARHEKLMDTLVRDLAMAGRVTDADVVHGHTWYSHFAGCLAKQLAGSKLILTTHSLEPHRPWKVEQLGTAYHASSWIERTAYQNADGVIAVSESMRDDVHELYDVPLDRIEVIPNGIDLDEYAPTTNPAVLERYGIEPNEPFVLFVGRITRQKGILHLVNAIQHLAPGTQVVLAAGAPDTPEIGKEMEDAVSEARKTGTHQIIWIPKMMPREDIIVLYSHAAVFVCPSVYEPFGIINLEAMACETPVVASAVGGIPEIVVPEKTGLLVEFEARGETDFEPKQPDVFARDLAEGINRLLASRTERVAMGQAARQRVEDIFSWRRVAERTLTFYQKVANR